MEREERKREKEREREREGQREKKRERKKEFPFFALDLLPRIGRSFALVRREEEEKIALAIFDV